jgi:hypothetical protein
LCLQKLILEMQITKFSRIVGLCASFFPHRAQSHLVDTKYWTDSHEQSPKYAS